VVADTKGNLYGATPDGGTYNVGTVYQLTKQPNGTYIHRTIYQMSDKGGNQQGMIPDGR
jgi:uncharacterized repeat protein (TIGR03803 family)